MPLLSICNLLIQLKKQGHLSSLFSIPFFLYPRSILEYSLFTAIGLPCCLVGSALQLARAPRCFLRLLHSPLQFQLGQIEKPSSWERRRRRKVTGMLQEEAGLPAARGQIIWSYFYLCEIFKGWSVTQRLTWWLLTCSYRGLATPRAVRDRSWFTADNHSNWAAFGDIRLLKSAAGARQNECIRCTRRVKDVHQQKTTSQWIEEGIAGEKEVAPSMPHELSWASL